MMWFGNLRHAQWVPSPATGMVRTQSGYAEELELQNGGLWLEESAGSHAIFPMDFPVQDASQYEGIEAFPRFKSGEYGRGYLYFVDGMYSDVNLFAPNWANPGLIEEGWKNFGGGPATFSATPANDYGKPLSTATWNVTSAASARFGKYFTILIPPNSTLHLGGSGAVTGSGELAVLPILRNGALAAVVPLELSAVADIPAMTSEFSGETYSAVRVHLRRTGNDASTVSVNALWAQVLLADQTPVLYRHLPGRGTTGAKFSGAVIVEPYTMHDRHLAGMSITLAEVEAWEPPGTDL